MKTECNFCEKCGTAYTERVWPRVCSNCHHIRYLNPVAAAIAMVPVEDTLLYVKRAIEPQKGLWAMPGGFMDFNESAEEAAARELKEETGLELDSDLFKVFGPTRKTTTGIHTLIFCIARIQPLSWSDAQNLIKIDPREVLDIAPYHPSMKSAFSLHDDVINLWMRVSKK